MQSFLGISIAWIDITKKKQPFSLVSKLVRAIYEIAELKLESIHPWPSIQDSTVQFSLTKFIQLLVAHVQAHGSCHLDRLSHHPSTSQLIPKTIMIFLCLVDLQPVFQQKVAK